MSRVGRLPIPLPKEVVVKIENGEVFVKGPKGELHRNLGSDISISTENNTLVVARANDERDVRARHAAIADQEGGTGKRTDAPADEVGLACRSHGYCFLVSAALDAGDSRRHGRRS